MSDYTRNGDDDHPVLGDIGLDDDNVIDRVPAKQRQKLAPPPRFAVVMLNDDFTPIDFVIAVLMKLFDKSADEAEAITMDVHKKGKGVAGVYTKDIAETKVILVNKVAQENEHPFLCQVEPA